MRLTNPPLCQPHFKAAFTARVLGNPARERRCPGGGHFKAGVLGKRGGNQEQSQAITAVKPQSRGRCSTGELGAGGADRTSNEEKEKDKNKDKDTDKDKDANYE